MIGMQQSTMRLPGEFPDLAALYPANFKESSTPPLSRAAALTRLLTIWASVPPNGEDETD